MNNTIVQKFITQQQYAMTYYVENEKRLIEQFVSRGVYQTLEYIDQCIHSILLVKDLSISIQEDSKHMLQKLLVCMHIHSGLGCHIFEPETSSDTDELSEITNKQILQRIQSEGYTLFKKKNRDYGNSFATHGVIGVLIRMGDKIARIQTLEKKKRCDVTDESIRDTCLDLHNYAIMALLLIDDSD